VEGTPRPSTEGLGSPEGRPWFIEQLFK